MAVKIQKVDYLSVVEGPMSGLTLSDATVENAEAVLRSVNSKVDHDGYDKVDCTVTLEDTEAGETLQMDLSPDIRQDSTIDLMLRASLYLEFGAYHNDPASKLWDSKIKGHNRPQ